MPLETPVPFAHHAAIFSASQIEELSAVFADVLAGAGGKRYTGLGLKQLLARSALQPLFALMEDLMEVPHAMRAMAFRKTVAANWFVPAHQDRSIPVPFNKCPPNFSNLTRKRGQAGEEDHYQAEAPLEFLNQMRNFRIFIDPCTESDGPMEVLAETESMGRLTKAEIAEVEKSRVWKPLLGHAGDVAIFCPLTVHRSARAARPTGRRVIQVECAPGGLAEAMAL